MNVLAVDAGMTSLLENLGAFFTQVVAWGKEIIAMIVAEPVLLISVFGFLIVGFVVGWVSRLFRA